MSIVSSVIVKDRNDGGTRFIEERHTDSQGVVYVRKRNVPIGYDAAADLAAHATELSDSLAEREVSQLLEID